MELILEKTEQFSFLLDKSGPEFYLNRR